MILSNLTLIMGTSIYGISMLMMNLALIEKCITNMGCDYVNMLGLWYN